MSEDQGRRSDDVDPAVQLAIDKGDAQTRHSMRDEIAALSAKVELWRAESTREHGEVSSKLDRLVDEVAALKPQTTMLAAEVAALKLADATAEVRSATAEQLRAQSRTQFRWLVALIVAAVPSIAVLVQLFAH